MVTDNDVNTGGTLAGVRVLDFGRVVAGPHCAQLMCAMGADVIKVERPIHGDDSRFDPFIYEPGLSAAFMQQNWGKRSLSIDLRHPDAKPIIQQLVAGSDVVIENFRPGVMAKLGFSYEALSAINPRVIMCAISAFGQTGPYADRLGYGPIAEALAAIPELTGEPDGPPMPTQYPIADNMAAALACASVCAALYWRDRSGVGQFIDMSLLDAAFQGQDLAIEQYLASGGKAEMRRRGLRDVTFVPWGFFQGRDGWVVIMCGNESMWPPLAKAMGREDMIKDPRYDNFAHRYENRDVIYRIVEDWVRSHDSIDRVVEILVGAGVPCDRVNTVAEATRHPQVMARKLLVEREHPTLGKMLVVNSGLHFSRTPADIKGHPPFLGEHNEEVLEGLLGLPASEVKRLTETGVLYQDPRSKRVAESADR
jgi:crotonobetainyl-CoA:carnitine CoA-transferase CaiB-like acyl-CoA transferase